jgi:hypothetical protein
MNGVRRNLGFTLIEALVSVVLLSVGIVASLTAIGHMIKGEALMQEGERMRRLADEKLSELVATGEYLYLTEGDFADRSETRYTWTAELQPTGTENLQAFTVRVVHANRRDDTGYEAAELVFVPPVDTEGGAP